MSSGSVIHWLPAAVLSGFVLAGAAPWLTRATRGRAGLFLSLMPLGLFLYFLTFIGSVPAGDALLVGWNWAPEFGLKFSFRLDGLSLLMALLICGMGVLVFVYSGAYLKEHPQQGQFYCYLLLFMASMLGLVLADNVLLLFVFWELTSLSSYLLIGFDHEKETARDAAWQALLVTAFGGLALLAGAILAGQMTGSYEISDWERSGAILRQHALYVPVVMLFIGSAFTKSAQFPFHFWLPSAMEAPTPVSAYLHSATMVKAGVYLLARLHPVFGAAAIWGTILTSVGAATLCAGVLLAFSTTDVKKMLAYLTVSALGFMTMLLGVGSEGAVEACLVFLIAHGFYKGALFMVAGAIDHETGTRDLLKLGGLRRSMPITMLAAIVASFSLAGFGPVLGFIAKEAALESMLHSGGAGALLAGATVFAAAGYVCVAAVFVSRTFFGSARLPARREPPAALWIGPLLLAGAGVILGIWPSWIESSIVAPSVAAVVGAPAEVRLKLWTGAHSPFWLSMISVAAGILAWRNWETICRCIERLRPALARGPEHAFGLAVIGLQRFADIQTRILQNGRLRSYLLTIVAFAAVLTGYTFVRGDIALPKEHLGMLRPYELVVAALILAGAAGAIWLQSSLGVIVSLGVVGYGVALLFIVFSAPDLAMTQFLVESLMLVIFVVAFYRLPRFEDYASVGSRARDVAVAMAFGCVVTVLVLATLSQPGTREVSQYFVDQSVPAAHGHNVVNLILVNFRALDTMGEVSVLVTAAVGIYSLLKLRLRKEEQR